MRSFASRHRLAGITLVLLAAGMTLASAALAGPYTRLQVLLPGENPAPGTSSGKTGTALAQVAGVPFSVRFRACDSSWNTVTSVTDVVRTLSSDASATLPPDQQFASGQLTVTVTFNAAGNFTVFGHDQTDNTIPDGVSATVASQVLQAFAFSAINQKNQTAGNPITITVTARDPSGNLVTGFSGVVSLTELTSFGNGRTSPDTVTMTSGSWTGGVAAFRADESSINRGNVNFYAWLASAPGKNGTSDPFTVHPGGFARLQAVVPGQNPLPGSVSGLTGSPATQSAGHVFPVTVNSTDNWWNPLGSVDNTRMTSSDAAANTPLTGALAGGTRSFNVSLGTVGTQTLTVADLTSGGITGMTTLGIPVIPSAVDHFVVSAIGSPQAAGTPVSVTIRATDVSGNTIPGYAGDANLAANTGPGSMSPERVTFAGGTWTGPITFTGAGGGVRFTCSDFSAPPHTGTSNSFTVNPGPMAGLQVILPGETAQGGTVNGKSGTPTDQTAGNSFVMTLRAVDAYWNLVTGVGDHVSLGSSDAFAGMPADTILSNGQLLVPVRLYRSGYQRIWAADADQPSLPADTSSQVRVVGGSFARLVVLAPGEFSAPGTANGRAGTATDQSINYAFTVTVLATDSWFNPVNGVTDVVHIGSDDPLATLPADTTLTDGRADLTMRLARGGYDLITVSDVSSPSKTGNSTQVRAITSGFHLEATVSPASVRAGDPFTVNVRVTNDAGSVIQEINSMVTLEAQNSSSRAVGRGTLQTTQIQLLQGQRTFSETYSYAEPIVLLAHDDQGNAPATSNPITITPGAPTAIHLVSNPPWVGGDKHATISAQLVDAYSNGVAGIPITFDKLLGNGTLTPIDTTTDSSGYARADFLSARQPGTDKLRASAAGFQAQIDVQTSFVDPNAAGGTITNYPNPFQPPLQPTTVAWKLSDDANVTLRIFTLSGDLVLTRDFARGASGGTAGLNAWIWDGRNGKGAIVASGGYIALVEAHGNGETLHVMRRKIAVVR